MHEFLTMNQLALSSYQQQEKRGPYLDDEVVYVLEHELAALVPRATVRESDAGYLPRRLLNENVVQN